MKPREHARRMARGIQRQTGMPYHKARRIAGRRVRSQHKPDARQDASQDALEWVPAVLSWTFVGLLAGVLIVAMLNALPA